MLQFDPASRIFFQKFTTINVIKKSVHQTPALSEENKVPLFNRSKGHGSGCTTAFIAECPALFTVHFSNNTQNLCRSTVVWRCPVIPCSALVDYSKWTQFLIKKFVYTKNSPPQASIKYSLNPGVDIGCQSIVISTAMDLTYFPKRGKVINFVL